MHEVPSPHRPAARFARVALRWLLVAAAVATTAWAAWRLFRGGPASPSQTVLERGRDVLYVCKACGQSGSCRIAYDEPFPIVCPHCRQKQAVPGFRCVVPRCGQIVADGGPTVYRCPRCGFVYDGRMPP